MRNVSLRTQSHKVRDNNVLFGGVLANFVVPKD